MVDLATGEQCACKSISKRKLVSQEDMEDVRREIKVMHHLSGHPHVVTFNGGENSSSHQQQQESSWPDQGCWVCGCQGRFRRLHCVCCLLLRSCTNNSVVVEPVCFKLPPGREDGSICVGSTDCAAEQTGHIPAAGSVFT